MLSERFEIRSQLGAGSFGTVYEALDRQRDRVVALKVLERVTPETVARFKREFRTLAGLRHPNLASLYELLVIDGQWMLTMELIRGSELLEHLAFAELQHTFVQNVAGPRKVSPIYVQLVRETFQQLAVALSVLHAHGVVHRDIKPSNIMIARDGRVVVLDFGLAIEESLDDTLDRRHVVGTPGYMSPEQISASAPTAASDWYSFGVLLYQALTGKMPFEGGSAMDILHRQFHSDAPDAAASVDGIPDDLASLARACLHRDAAQRPSDVDILSRLGVHDFDPGRIERGRQRAGDLVGRGRELRTLQTWLNILKPGEARIFLIEGAPGVGKSALLDRFLDSVRAAGDTLILAGRCQPWESLPLNAVDAVVDALSRELRHSASPDINEILGRSMAMAELFPQLASAGAPMADETIAIPRGATLVSRAASELRALIHAVAGERTILLVLDDAQWGDYQSARMVLRLMDKAGSHRIALVLSYTSDDWRTSLLLQALDLGEVRPAPRRLVLRDLSRASTVKLAGNKRRGDDLYRRTGGNPALIQIASNHHEVSPAAQRLYDFLLNADGPVEQAVLQEKLELFEIDEPLRSLAAQRLIRIRRTGNLSEIDVYHPRLRDEA